MAFEETHALLGLFFYRLGYEPNFNHSFDNQLCIVDVFNPYFDKKIHAN